MIRVGVIGVGAMGKHHARIYSQMDDVELVGVADIDDKIAMEIALRYNTEPFNDPETLLKKDLDAVSIAVPTTLHKDVALKAANYAVPMLIEKPIAESLESADAIINAAKRENIKLLIGHIERFNSVILELKEVISSGELGELLSISCRRVGPYPPRIKDVGIIIDLAVHDIDVISYLYGKRAMSVYTVAGNGFHIKEDYATLLLKYSEEKSGMVETNWLTPYKIRKLTATGTEGVAHADYLEQSLAIWNKKGQKEMYVEKREPLKNELEHFLNTIVNDTEPSPSGEEGKYALHVALSAIKSYENRENISLVA